ncbi:MAG: hypothetical protein CSA81_09070 [Acidobacteria bacterium]|nr:MAG: hypothetical protein CSA81_09070 [Acidobacteriota bacterium]
MGKYALLIDGGFLIRKLTTRNRFPQADQIEAFARKVCDDPRFDDHELLRIYFYHAEPYAGKMKNPISRKEMNYADTPTYANHKRLIDNLELRYNFAVRLGEINARSWKLGSKAAKDIFSNPREVQAQDLVPVIEQKGVDLRIALDISRLSLCHLVESIIVVTGDSDFIPAFKFARREGIRVYLVTLNHGVKRDLKVHVDVLLDDITVGED